MAATNELSCESVLEIVCLLSDFCTLADMRDIDGLCALFSPDARLQLGDGVHVGQDAIRRMMCERLLNKRMTRHLWTNPNIRLGGEGLVRCTATQLRLDHADGSERPEVRIGEVRDVLRHEAEGRWLIQERVVLRVMSW